MDEARKCSGCGVNGFVDILRFSELLRSRIETVIAEVSKNIVIWRNILADLFVGCTEVVACSDLVLYDVLL